MADGEAVGLGVLGAIGLSGRGMEPAAGGPARRVGR